MFPIKRSEGEINGSKVLDHSLTQALITACESFFSIVFRFLQAEHHQERRLQVQERRQL